MEFHFMYVRNFAIYFYYKNGKTKFMFELATHSSGWQLEQSILEF